MGKLEKRKYRRVNTNVKVKLSGDALWIECTTSDVSGGGLCFDTERQFAPGDIVALQFMLQSKTEKRANVHFFASARVIRIIPKGDAFRTAVEFIIDENIREEIIKLVKIINSQNLKVDRPNTLDAVLLKIKQTQS